MKLFLKCIVIYISFMFICILSIPFIFNRLGEIPEIFSINLPTQQSSLQEYEEEQTSFSEFILYDVTTGETISLSEMDFLIGSLASEMGTSVPIEALKAQTVASYSYYSFIRQENADDAYHISYSSEYSSVYTDIESLDENSLAIYSEAVESVYGEILEYNGITAYASFFNSSTGATESALEVWGEDIPYLVSVASPYDTLSAGGKDVFQYSAEEISLRLSNSWGEENFDFTTDYENWFSKISYTIGLTVTAVTICGFTITGEEFRQCFGLSSPCFSIVFEDDKFVFTCSGQGSLVGMSQTGAVYMAAEGASYNEILAWYYPDTEIVKQ